MAYGDIPVPIPDSAPEPPGLGEAVKAAFAKLTGQGPALLPAQPQDPYAALTDEQLVEEYTNTMQFCEVGREPLEWQWWKKIHYVLGNQWIYWNPNTRSFQDKRLAKWIPKPVTNKIDETVAAIMAMQSDIVPGATFRPVGERLEAQVAAQTADDIIPLLHDEHEMEEMLWDADYWADLLGDVFLNVHWDKTQGQPATWQMDRCTNPQCLRVSGPEEIVKAGQKCPQCGSPVEPALGPDGKPVYEKAFIGKGRTIVASPLEVYLPLYAQNFKLADRLVYGTWRAKHLVEDEVGADLAKRIQWGSSPEYRSLQLYRSLQTFPGAPFTPTAFAGSGLQGETQGVSEMHLWIKPCKKYPRGLYMKYYGEKSPVVARVDGTGPIPNQDLDGNPLWPWIHYPYRHVGGRLYSISAVDQILKKQDQLNQVDSMTHLTLNRMGNSVWLQPKGAEVERFTGEPGLIVKYQAVGPNGAKPERISGENPPQAAFTMRQQHLADIEDLAGTQDVIKGSKPTGVEAFSALQLLVERSQSRFTPMFKARGKAYAAWAMLAIEMERRHGPTERVKNVEGPNGSWTHEIFQRSKLGGSIAVRVEDGSTTPKTALGQRAAIEHLNQLGMIDPTSPDTRYEIYKKFGTLYLAPGLDANVKSALREQDQFERWVNEGMQGIEQLVAWQEAMEQYQMAPPPPQVDMATGMAAPPPPPQMPAVSPLSRKPWHDDPVHLQEHTKWMNSDRILELMQQAVEQLGIPDAETIIEIILANHLAEHAEMLAPPPMAGPPGAPPEAAGAGQAMANSNRNSSAPAPPQAPQHAI